MSEATFSHDAEADLLKYATTIKRANREIDVGTLADWIRARLVPAR